MILAIKTDQPEATLVIVDRHNTIKYYRWLADRTLADTLLAKIKQFLTAQRYTYSDITGIIFFAGPGSFTGLRIGASVANTLAYGLDCPIVAAKSSNWLTIGLAKVKKQPVGQFVTPFYGAKLHITKPKR